MPKPELEKAEQLIRKLSIELQFHSNDEKGNAAGQMPEKNESKLKDLQNPGGSAGWRRPRKMW